MRRLPEPQDAVALDLVGKVYEAAARPDLWPRFLEGFAAATHGEATAIWLHDTADGSASLEDSDLSFLSRVRMSPDVVKSYLEHFTYVNPLLGSLDTAAEGVVLTSDAVMPRAAFSRTEYYADWLRPQGTSHVVVGSHLKGGRAVAVFGSCRSGPYRGRDSRLVTLLMPHLRRACLLHRRLGRLDAERSGVLAALDLLPTTVWVLDAQGRLLSANRAGRELDRRHDGLWIDRDGSPAAADPAAQHELHQLVADAVAAGRGRSVKCASRLSIRRRRSAAPLEAMVYPLPPGALVQSSAVAVFVFDPERIESPDTQVLGSLFGLTGTEVKLAVSLARGESLEDYCRANRVTANTARTHLKRALAKTGTHRQVQLVSLLARLPKAGALSDH